LEWRAQRLDEPECQVVGQSADVVVRLDVRRAGAAARFDHVGVERALDQELDVAGGRYLARCTLESANELAANDLALLLRVDDAGRRTEEAGGGLKDFGLDPGRRDVVLLDLLALAGSQQAVIHEDARHLVTDGFVYECRRDRRVDASGQPADDLLVADLLP